MELEKSLPNFRGINDRVVQRDDFIKLFTDFVDVALYNRVSQDIGSRTLDRTYSANQSFWLDALNRNHFEGMRIRLERFHIGEWIPSSPGRYFTGKAEHARNAAERYVSYGGEEYLPLGKEYMVLGGIGTVRLAAKMIESKMFYFLGATSTGISHQGIPIALHESDYRRAISHIKEDGGCYATIEGTLRILPTSVSLIKYERDVPRYCLFVDGLDLMGSATKEMLTTVAIMFPSSYHTYDGKERSLLKDGYTTQFPKSWSFASFHPGKRGRKLSEAVEWLKDYSLRYSSIPNPPILADFDEHYQHFENPIEFPIQELFKKGLDVERLAAYGQYYGLTINIEEIVMGDKFEHIRNATIVNRSIVQNAFNKVRSEYNEEIAQALEKVADEIEKSKSIEAAENFNSFGEELQKPEPKKSVLRTLWNGVTNALPSILQMADAVAKISKLFTS